jgi:hypothetical protein
MVVFKMVSAEKLLSGIWRGEGVHQIGTLKDGIFKNIPVKSLIEAEQKAKDFSAKGYEVYFACAEFETNDNRRASNAKGAWGYWFDIDCGKDKFEKGLGYPTKSAANAALISFLEQTKLANPDFIVDSGNGLHVYFFSDSFIPREQWQIGANKLKALTEYYKFIVDPSRTADIASVLRFPDTKNYKDPANPKSVRVVYPKRGDA